MEISEFILLAVIDVSIPFWFIREVGIKFFAHFNFCQKSGQGEPRMEEELLKEMHSNAARSRSCVGEKLARKEKCFIVSDFFRYFCSCFSVGTSFTLWYQMLFKSPRVACPWLKQKEPGCIQVFLCISIFRFAFLFSAILATRKKSKQPNIWWKLKKAIPNKLISRLEVLLNLEKQVCKWNVHVSVMAAILPNKLEWDYLLYHKLNRPTEKCWQSMYSIIPKGMRDITTKDLNFTLRQSGINHFTYFLPSNML